MKEIRMNATESPRWLALAATFVIPCAAVAQSTLTWDSNTTTTGAQDGAGTWNTSNTNWWNGTTNVSFTGGTNVIFGAGAGAGAAGSIAVDAGGVTAGDLTFNAPGSGSYAFTGGSITGGVLTKNGSNGLRFDNANTFTSITVNAGANSQSDGALRLGNANALGTAPITFANTADMTGLYFLTAAGNAVNFSNNVAFTTTAGRQTRLLLTSNTTGGPQTVTFSGLLTGGVSTSKIRLDGTVGSGQSVVRLTNASNTVTLSEWEVWRGALEITSDAALGNANNAIRLNVGAANDPVGTGFRFGANNITLAATRSIFISDRSNINTQTFTGSQINGAITFNNTLVKKGTTTLTLAGTATGTGGVRIDEGRLSIAGAGNLGSGSIAFNAVGTGLEITGTAATLANNISLPTSGTGNITLLTANNSSTVLNGTISGGGTGTVLFFQGGGPSQNTGALTLNGTNTLAGTINVQRGPLILGNASAAGTANIVLDSNSPPAGALQLGSFTIANSLQLTGGASVGVGTGNSAGISGVVQGGATFTKLGAGSLTLSGVNTYTGATLVSAGTLALSSAGTIDNTSGVQVSLGATLDISAKSGYTINNVSGNGTVSGNLTVGNLLSVGTSPGSMNFTNLSLAAAATYLHEVTGGGSAADFANVSGNLDLGDSTLDLVQLGTYTVGDKFTLFGYSGSLTGTFSGLADGAIFNDAGGDWMIDYDDALSGLNGGVGSSFVTITAVPEPGSAALGLAALGLLFWRRRP
ncbi:MAG: autotransporter-associated beta strand repeat-containing protein [Akkermansiaceae bacterium]|jgi:MYXO-CTERM domain-containing protein|nr:autotransporter-associated beta strand repeat-containing protein [Akkermansiaceae bacterium]